MRLPRSRATYRNWDIPGMGPTRGMLLRYERAPRQADLNPGVRHGRSGESLSLRKCPVAIGPTGTIDHATRWEPTASASRRARTHPSESRRRWPHYDGTSILFLAEDSAVVGWADVKGSPLTGLAKSLSELPGFIEVAASGRSR
jgi:hypothetical protein